MVAARVAKPIDHRVEVFRLPTPDKVKLAREIRQSGGTVPEKLRPTRLGVFQLARTAGQVRAKKEAGERAAEVAKQHKCRVRSVARGQRSWVAYIIPIEA